MFHCLNKKSGQPFYRNKPVVIADVIYYIGYTLTDMHINSIKENMLISGKTDNVGDWLDGLPVQPVKHHTCVFVIWYCIIL